MSHILQSNLRHTSSPALRQFTQGSRRLLSSPASGSQYQVNRALIWSCIGGSVAVFGAWGYSLGSWGTNSGGGGARARGGSAISTWNTKRMRAFLDDNFTLKPSDMDNGRYWTLLTPAFSHIGFGHLLGNMFSLHAFGSYCAFMIAPGSMATLLVGSAVAGSIGWLYHEKMNKQRTYNEPRALGASGMVMGVGSAAMCLLPNARVLLFAVVPVPLWVLVPAYFVYDAYYLNAQDSRVGHAGHIGGSIFGVVYYALFLRKFGGILGPRMRGF